MYRCRECKAEYREKVEYCDCGNNTFDYIEDSKPAVKQASVKQPHSPLTLEQKSEIVSRIFFALCIILSILVWMIPAGEKPADTNKTNPPAKQKPAATKNIPDIEEIWDDTPLYEPRPKTEPAEQPMTPADYVRQLSQSVTQINKPKTAVNNLSPAQISQPAPKTSSAKPSAPKKTEQVQKKNNNIKKDMPVNPELLTPSKPQKPSYNPNSPVMLRYKNNLRAALFSKFAVGSIQGSGECSIQFSVDKTGKLINRKFSKESSNKGLNDTVYYMLMSVPRFSPPPDEYNGETIRMNFKINNGDYEITIH